MYRWFVPIYLSTAASPAPADEVWKRYKKGLNNVAQILIEISPQAKENKWYDSDVYLQRARDKLNHHKPQIHLDH